MWQAGSSAEGGFTLLEALIVLVILSLAATAAGLSLPGTGDRVQLTEAGARLDRLLVEARTAARREGAMRVVAFDLAGRRQRIEGLSEWETWPAKVNLAIVSAREVGEPGLPRIVFLGDGTSSGGRLTLSVGDHAASRQVEWLTGSIRHGER